MGRFHILLPSTSQIKVLLPRPLACVYTWTPTCQILETRDPTHHTGTGTPEAENYMGTGELVCQLQWSASESTSEQYVFSPMCYPFTLGNEALKWSGATPWISISSCLQVARWLSHGALWVYVPHL
ncbi:hypothetical protein Y1Q_0017450 [Alligator mississippiensis]|uniref:Uncharacterized protein n=1 Tax=Alligator mississippiensis TaxID=8496 RepID=A0A151P204_ALLMI|nr:hypothetical protein Y1Q_0017450 [Alligator mississippiensis]